MGPEANPVDLERLFDTVVGTVTLRAGDLGLQRDFYERALGLAAREADAGVVELDDAQGRTLIRLDSTRSAGSPRVAEPHTGLFHTAFRYPDRTALATAVARMAAAKPEYQGASDHGVSEAVYFADAEGNGIELYRDRPYDEWPPSEPGAVAMYTQPLDMRSLLAAAADPEAVATCDVGHIHLMTSDVDAVSVFFREALDFDERQRLGPQAVFLSEGLYHHHVGANTWQSAGAGPAPETAPGLDGYELHLRSAESVERVAEALAASGRTVEREGGAVTFRDADSNRVLVHARPA